MFAIHFLPHFFLLQLNLTFMKRILHLFPVKTTLNPSLIKDKSVLIYFVIFNCEPIFLLSRFVSCEQETCDCDESSCPWLTLALSSSIPGSLLLSLCLTLAHSCPLLLSLTHSGSLWLTLALYLAHSGPLWFSLSGSLALSDSLGLTLAFWNHSGSLWLYLSGTLVQFGSLSGSITRSSTHKVLAWLTTS